ncbi:hypothetical protein VTO58DRAFT_103927 [Aureobasidium pullulans]
MRSSLFFGLAASGLVANALPSNSKHLRRQDIDFDLVDETPEPSKSPTDTQNYNQASAIAAVINDVNSDPLPQQTTDGTSLLRRDVVVVTADGYNQNTALNGAAINAPLNCNKADTYMGVKLFNEGPFDTTLCAAACTAQTNYNLKHSPTLGRAKTCQFYNTYEMYKDTVYQGQYCTLCTQAWDITYATNIGQWRGTSHYTIGRSFTASNATDSGVVSCSAQVASFSSGSTISSTSAASTITGSSSTSLSLTSFASSSDSASSSTSAPPTPASSSSMTSSSTTSSASICTFAPTVDLQQQEKDTAALDFLFSHNTLNTMLSSIPLNVMYPSTITGDILPSLQTALQNVVSCGPYNISSQLSACKTATNPLQFTSCVVAWTDPAFLSSWATYSPRAVVPTSALTRFINVCRAYIDQRSPEAYPIPPGVVLLPSMSPVAIMDALTASGSIRLQCEYKNMQYYYGEYKKLAPYC